MGSGQILPVPTANTVNFWIRSLKLLYPFENKIHPSNYPYPQLDHCCQNSNKRPWLFIREARVLTYKFLSSLDLKNTLQILKGNFF